MIRRSAKLKVDASDKTREGEPEAKKIKTDRINAKLGTFEDELKEFEEEGEPEIEVSL